MKQEFARGFPLVPGAYTPTEDFDRETTEMTVAIAVVIEKKEINSLDNSTIYWSNLLHQ